MTSYTYSDNTIYNNYCIVKYIAVDEQYDGASYFLNRVYYRIICLTPGPKGD